MLARDDFLDYVPRPDEPLVVSFIEFCRDRGLSSRISYGVWDFYVHDGADEPILAVKTAKNALSDALLTRLVTEPTPMKAILLEGDHPAWERLEGQKLFLASTGTGVYVRNVGWRVLPGQPINDTVEDLRLKLAPRWNQDEDGTWRKACSKCGELKTRNEFYRSQYPTLKDPFRHICVACYRQRSS